MRVALSSVLLLLTGCTDYELKEQQDVGADVPAIRVEPSSLAFGEIASGASASQVFTIHSDGGVALAIEEVLLDSAAFTITSGDAAGRLEPGESIDVVVTYAPINPADAAWALIRSDASGRPEVRVDLTGGGLLPGLVLDPPALDFGSVEEGASTTGSIAMVNNGGSTVTVTSVTLTGDPSFASLYAEALPVTLEPGASAPVDLSFAPSATGRFEGTLWVGSDSPGGVVSAPITGQSGVPVAVCSVSPGTVYANAETATFDGSASYDPGGRALSAYEWTLVTRPAGSAASLPRSGGAVLGGFAPDLAGVYEAALVVENDLGMRSDACVATLEAVPAQDLWIEMFWEHNGDDMDLHLLRPGGALTTSGDCYYANCVGGGPDWGVGGDPDDDPSLDIDDIPGTGPENINVWSPEDGTFKVYVHDYPGSYYSGGNDVTVRIYVAGALAWEDQLEIAGEDDYVPFAEVSWPDGIVTPL